MNLVFRMLRVILAAFFRRRLGLLDESVLDFRVWPTDLDLNVHMNNGRYLTLMDLGRADLMIRCGLLGPVLRRRWLPVLGASTVRYRRSLGPFQAFRLRSRLVGWDGKWLYIQHRVETRDGTLACAALVKGAFRARHGTVPPAEVLSLLGAAQPSPPLPAALASWAALEQGLSAAEIAP